MKFTDDAPNTAGWYLMKGHDGRITREFVGRVQCLSDDGVSVFWMVYPDGPKPPVAWTMPLENWAQWCGPLDDTP